MVLSAAVGDSLLRAFEARLPRVSDCALHTVEVEQLVRERAGTASNVEDTSSFAELLDTKCVLPSNRDREASCVRVSRRCEPRV